MQQLYDKLKAQFALDGFNSRRPDLAFVTVGREQLRPLLRSQSGVGDHEG